jgi:hypothetical protein
LRIVAVNFLQAGMSAASAASAAWAFFLLVIGDGPCSEGPRDCEVPADARRCQNSP